MFFIRFLAFHAMLLYNKISIFKTLLEFRGVSNLSCKPLFIWNPSPWTNGKHSSLSTARPCCRFASPKFVSPSRCQHFLLQFYKKRSFFFNSLFNIDLTFFYLEKYIWHITLFQKGLANSWILWIASKWFESYSTGRKEVVFINDSDPEISDIMWCTTWMSFLLVFVHITISIMS